MGFNVLIGILQSYVGLLICCSMYLALDTLNSGKRWCQGKLLYKEWHRPFEQMQLPALCHRGCGENVAQSTIPVLSEMTWVTNKDTELSSQGCLECLSVAHHSCVCRYMQNSPRLLKANIPWVTLQWFSLKFLEGLIPPVA